MAPVAESLLRLARLPGVPAALEQAAEACTQLRWHQALRRRTAEATAESRVRGAHATATLDGARFELAAVRDLVRGAAEWPEQSDAALRVLRGAVQATAATEQIQATVRTAPRQSWARMHVAAASELCRPEQLGRPRQPGEDCAELRGVGPPVRAELLPARLDGLAEVVLASLEAPALVVAAVVHAELATLRPFLIGNGVVARAVERALLHERGLDRTGVAVPEVGHLREGVAGYVGALSAYRSGSREGMALWLRHCAGAVVVGAQEGSRIADAVLEGRLRPP